MRLKWKVVYLWDLFHYHDATFINPFSRIWMCKVTVYQKIRTCLSLWLNKESKKKIYDHYVVNNDDKLTYDNASCFGSPEKYGCLWWYVIFWFSIIAFFSNKNKWWRRGAQKLKLLLLYLHSLTIFSSQSNLLSHQVCLTSGL